MYIRLLGEAEPTREAVAGMRLFISGSAPLSADIHRELRERTGHAILERYGMTKTDMNTSSPYAGARIAGRPAAAAAARRLDWHRRRGNGRGHIVG